MNEAVLLYTTWPDPETAQRAVQAALEAGEASSPAYPAWLSGAPQRPQAHGNPAG